MTGTTQQSNDRLAFTVGQRVVITQDITSHMLCEDFDHSVIIAHGMKGEVADFEEVEDMYCVNVDNNTAASGWWLSRDWFTCLPQPGDGLPPSEPTDDIGTLDKYAVAHDKILFDFEALNATLQIPLSLHDFIGSRIVKLQAERDTLVAQLARVQVVIDGLPSERPGISRLVTFIEALEFDRAYLQGKYDALKEVEAALKGEAK